MPRRDIRYVSSCVRYSPLGGHAGREATPEAHQYRGRDDQHREVDCESIARRPLHQHQGTQRVHFIGRWSEVGQHVGQDGIMATG